MDRERYSPGEYEVVLMLHAGARMERYRPDECEVVVMLHAGANSERNKPSVKCYC